MGTLVGHA